MEANLDTWREIARIIEKDKEGALDYFRRQKIDPAEVKARPAERPFRLLAPRPVFWLAAASLFLAIGLVSFWLLRGSWKSSPLTTVGSELLADSFLYAEAGQANPAAERGAPGDASPCFTAWATAARQLAFSGDEASAPAYAPDEAVERGDPEEVLRRIGRVIRKGAFNHLLSNLNEFHDKEA
ncbi:MAG TPA: hypothetical protein VMZ49_10130 [Patescibacteria group bacterium]|nr:hypothetical protein [Patescibacteria group bacterium]